MGFGPGIYVLLEMGGLWSGGIITENIPSHILEYAREVFINIGERLECVLILGIILIPGKVVGREGDKFWEFREVRLSEADGDWEHGNRF
jgi:hypothetical protein